MTEALTAALNAIDVSVPVNAPDKQQVIAAKCRGLMIGYHARWSDVQFEVLSVEDYITSGLYNPETERSSRTFTLAAKKDVTVRYEGQKVLIDHKTTSDDIEDPSSPYWRQLAVEAQPSHYMLIDWLRGEKIDYAIWDVVRKPGISPKEISAADHKNTLITGAYCGYKISEESIAALGTSKRETLEMYTARLADDCMRQRPQRYFQRRTVPRLDHQIAEHAREVWGLAKSIMDDRLANRWPRNSKACMQYGSPCRFLGICSGHDDPESGQWAKKDSVHNELPLLEGDGRSVLTFSRLGSYQTCRRKHFYDYELGIERYDEEEREALFFGNVWHAAQEAWFKYQLTTAGEKNNGNNADLAPVNGIAAIGGTGSQSLAF
jgi:hypothetical protein